MADTPADDSEATIRQLGPEDDERSPSAASGVNASESEPRGPYPSPSAPDSAGNVRVCSCPQVRPPTCATADANAVRITDAAVRPAPKAALAGSDKVHVSRSSSRAGMFAGSTASPVLSFDTGTLYLSHHGSNTPFR